MTARCLQKLATYYLQLRLGLQVHPSGGQERHQTLGWQFHEGSPGNLLMAESLSAGMHLRDRRHPAVEEQNEIMLANRGA
jgi:hypothetical protein